MIDSTPEIPLEFQPDPAELSFDLDKVLASMVSLRTNIPEDAFTAPMLGTERQGHGVVIREGGLILTIGYLIVEAEQIWMIDSKGRAIAGHPLGYDQETGFGLIQALDPSGLTPVEIGRSHDLAQGDPVILAGAGGRSFALQSEIVSVREFAGYWEYLLDEALFISPAHPFWGGGALFGIDGTLRGIGSLYVQNAISYNQYQEGNMVVPIDLLAPIVDELATTGQTTRPGRAWLGMITTETAGKVVVAGLWDGGPAEQAGIEVGDLLLEVDGTPVTGMADMLRNVWALGVPGVEVPLIVFRDRGVREIRITSSSRSQYYKPPRIH